MFCGPPPPAPTNGGLSTFSSSSASSSSVVQFPTFGTVVEYTCGEGRRLFTEEEGMHDTTAVQCQWDGTWNPSEVRICLSRAVDNRSLSCNRMRNGSLGTVFHCQS